MSDLRAQRSVTGWREHLTREEESELAGIDAKLIVLRRRAQALSIKRIRIQNRATQRARASQ